MKIELSQPLFKERIASMGIGLIGGSLARALKRHNSVGKIIAYDQNEAALQKAYELGDADEIYIESIRRAENEEVIILATRSTSMGKIVKVIIPYLKEDSVKSDVGSTKVLVLVSIKADIGYHPERFVPAHPIAVTEKHG